MNKQYYDSLLNSCPRTDLDIAVDTMISAADGLASFDFEEVTQGVAGLEGINQALTTIKGVQINLFASLKGALMVGQKSFKTEYSDWVRKNSKLIAKVEAMPYDSTKDYTISIPAGMRGRYPEVAADMLTFFTVSKIEELIASLQKVADTVQVSIAQGNNSCEQKLQAEFTVLNVQLGDVVKHIAKLDAMFNTSDSRAATRLFGNDFKSMTELATYREQLGNCDAFLAASKDVLVDLGEANKGIANIVDYITSSEEREPGDYEPTDKFVNNLAQYLNAINQILKAYGTTLIRTMALEHNTVLVYTKVGDA